VRLLAAFAALAMAAGCAPAPQPQSASEVVQQSLQWTGTAKVFAGDRTIDIGVSTRVTPFVRARSDSWLLEQGPSSTRSRIIEPDGGWIERAGKREPMPAAMLRHERRQFAIYGQMQMALARAVAEGRVTIPGSKACQCRQSSVSMARSG